MFQVITPPWRAIPFELSVRAQSRYYHAFLCISILVQANIKRRRVRKWYSKHLITFTYCIEPRHLFVKSHLESSLNACYRMDQNIAWWQSRKKELSAFNRWQAAQGVLTHPLSPFLGGELWPPWQKLRGSALLTPLSKFQGARQGVLGGHVSSASHTRYKGMRGFIDSTSTRIGIGDAFGFRWERLRAI